MMLFGKKMEWSPLRSGVARLILSTLLCALTVYVAKAQTAAPPVSIVDAFAAKDNSTVVDEDGDLPAYVVLRNNRSQTTAPLDLSGYALTSDSTGNAVWIFPPRTLIAPQSELIVFASGKNRPSNNPELRNHTDFIFPCEIPYVALLGPKREVLSTYRKLDPNCSGNDDDCRGTSLFHQKTISRYFVPTTDKMTGIWMEPDFDVSNWKRGPLGLGYEVLESKGELDMILYATMDRTDLDLAANIVKDVSGSPVVHDGLASQKIAMTTGQIQQGIEMVQGQAIRFRHHDELDPGTSDFTVSIWCRTFGQGDEVIIAKGGLNAETTGWAIFNRKDATIVRLSFGKAGVVDLSLPRLEVERWTHFAFVIDRTQKSAFAYVNGVLAANAGIPSDALLAPRTDMWIGARPDGNPLFTGTVDETVIWRRALSKGEIRTVALQGADGKRLDAAVSTGTPIYGDLIATDVESDMYGKGTSLYVRVPFLVSDPSLVSGLNLSMHYDDGFVCYLNGEEVARKNAPSTTFPGYDATASSDRADTLALTAESINLANGIRFLVPGENLLAIHGLNVSKDAGRFVIKPQLCLEETEPQDCEKTTNGRDFWLTFPGNAPEDTGNPLEISLCVAGAAGTNGHVDIPGLGFSKTFTIPANGPTPATGSLVLPLPKEVSLEISGKIEPKGVRVRAQADVSVYGTTRIDYSTDSFLGLPVDCIGRNYVAMGYKNVWEEIPVLNGSQIGLVAPYNGTKVLIDVGTSAAGGVPIEVSLNEGETYLLRDTGNSPADLSGSRILSNLPVGVFAGHRCANINGKDLFFCDTVLEQLLPISGWGTRYWNAPLSTRNHVLADGKGDTLRVTASEDNTAVTITDDQGANVLVLNANQIHEQAVIGPSYVVSEKPVLTAVYANSSDFDLVTDSDPFMVMLQPEIHWLDRYIICTPPTSDFEQSYVNIIARNTIEASTIRLNGAPIPGFLPLGASGYFYAQVDLDPALLRHTITSTRAVFGVTVYGFSEYDSYGYPGGMRFDSAGAPFVVCPPDITIPAGENCEGVIPDLSEFIQVVDPCDEGGDRPVPGDDCFEFEDLKLQTLIRDGDTLTITIASGDQTANVTASAAGFAAVAAVVNGGQAGHTGNEVRFANINLTFVSSAFTSGFSLSFGEYGGSVNLGVNNDLQTAANMEDFNGKTIGGAQVSVTGATGGQGTGTLTVSGTIRSFTIGGQEFFLDHICPGGGGTVEVPDCYEFEDQDAKLVLHVGDTTPATSSTGNSVTVLGAPFTWSNGQVTQEGSAAIRSNGQAGHTGNEFAVNNILLKFIPPESFPNGISILFGEYGGNVNLEVNGELANVSNFSELSGTSLGGAQILVTGGTGQGLGELHIIGELKEFGIGGQELFVDHLCALPAKAISVVDRINSSIGLLTRSVVKQARVGQNYIVKQDPPAGVMVSAGSYDVSVSVLDLQGNLIGACVTNVQIVDDSPVKIVCPPNIKVDCQRPEGALVFWEGPVAYTERCQVPVNVRSNYESGDFFPLGNTTVTCVAKSPSGEIVSCSFLVTVVCEDVVVPDNPTVSINLSGETGITLDWPAGGHLEAADSPRGPWQIVPEAKPPFNIDTIRKQAFYRIRY